jgi:hypothetical protein
MRGLYVLGPGLAGIGSLEPGFGLLEPKSRSGGPPPLTFVRGGAVGALGVCPCVAGIHAKRMRVAHYRAVLLTLDAEDEEATAVLDAARTVVDSVVSHLWCFTIALKRPWAHFARAVS